MKNILEKAKNQMYWLSDW